MSLESIQEFINVIEQDDDLKNELQQTLSKEATREDWINTAVRLGQARGYEYTTEEVNQFITLQMEEAEDSELEDAQLEAVAGGGKKKKNKQAWGEFMWEYNAKGGTGFAYM